MHTAIIIAVLAVLHVTGSYMQGFTFSSISTASMLTVLHDVLLELHIEFLMIHVQPGNKVRIKDIKSFRSGIAL